MIFAYSLYGLYALAVFACGVFTAVLVVTITPGQERRRRLVAAVIRFTFLLSVGRLKESVIRFGLDSEARAIPAGHRLGRLPRGLDAGGRAGRQPRAADRPARGP